MFLAWSEVCSIIYSVRCEEGRLRMLLHIKRPNYIKPSTDPLGTNKHDGAGWRKSRGANVRHHFCSPQTPISGLRRGEVSARIVLVLFSVCLGGLSLAHSGEGPPIAERVILWIVRLVRLNPGPTNKNALVEFQDIY